MLRILIEKFCEEQLYTKYHLDFNGMTDSCQWLYTLTSRTVEQSEYEPLEPNS